MKDRRVKIEIRARITRPGLPAESIVIHNHFTEEVARKRTKAIFSDTFDLGVKHLADEPKETDLL